MFKYIYLANLLALALCSSSLPKKCGKQLVNVEETEWRVYGGQDARKGEFPWQILITQNPNANVSAMIKETDFCGGTILNDRWVLTAAHCVTNPYDSSATDPNILVVRLGVHNMSLHEENEHDFSVEKNIPYYNWSGATIRNDIALLKLNETLDFNGKHSNLVPICLAHHDTNRTNKCVATGFGIFDDKHIHPIDGILQKLEMPIKQNDYCEKYIGNIFHPETQVCAGGFTEKGKTLCSGDSGGPLQCLGDDGLWYQYGTLSYGSGGCGSANAPDAFTRVSHYLDWIEQTISNK